MLVGREYEMASLLRLYSKPGFQLPVLYGRRRVGKTYLMSSFARDKPTIFFTAVEDNAAINLRNLSREIFLFDHPGADTNGAPIYRDFQTAFEAVFTLAQDKRLVFVVDEYPYLAKADSSVSSILQALIDRNKDDSNLFMMLCGSSLSFMREQVLGEKSPLYGRRTAQLELKPLDFFDARQFFPHMDVRDAVTVYGMVGGIPLYLLQFDENATLAENIESAFLDPSSILYEEPLNLLKQEVQKAPMYNAIIGAIASGKTENNQIATTAGIASAELSYYLKELQRIGLVEKEFPVVAGNRRAVYRLSDNLFRFWYRFIMPNRSIIERRMTKRALQSVEQSLPKYLGPVFEQVCAEWLWRQNVADNLPVAFDQLGRWWGNDPIERREEEIDLVCLDEGVPVLLGECKWRNEATGESVVQTLAKRGYLIGAGEEVHRYIFSKGAFTDGCLSAASRDSHLHLLTVDELMQ